jgi:hypothetical protein
MTNILLGPSERANIKHWATYSELERDTGQPGTEILKGSDDGV